jgi:hypothetical protein
MLIGVDDAERTSVTRSPIATVFRAVAVGDCVADVIDRAARPVTSVPLIFTDAVTVPLEVFRL